MYLCVAVLVQNFDVSLVQVIIRVREPCSHKLRACAVVVLSGNLNCGNECETCSLSIGTLQPATTHAPVMAGSNTQSIHHEHSDDTLAVTPGGQATPTLNSIMHTRHFALALNDSSQVKHTGQHGHVGRVLAVCTAQPESRRPG
jgi:hypothetical protein